MVCATTLWAIGSAAPVTGTVGSVKPNNRTSDSGAMAEGQVEPPQSSLATEGGVHRALGMEDAGWALP